MINNNAQQIFEIANAPQLTENEDLCDRIVSKAKKIVELARARLIPVEH